MADYPLQTSKNLVSSLVLAINLIPEKCRAEPVARMIGAQRRRYTQSIQIWYPEAGLILSTAENRSAADESHSQ